MGGGTRLSRFRRLARDYERLPETLKGLHFLAFAMLMAHRFVQNVAPFLYGQLVTQDQQLKRFIIG